jgi:SAM-dependent methyltransferase
METTTMTLDRPGSKARPRWTLLVLAMVTLAQPTVSWTQHSGAEHGHNHDSEGSVERWLPHLEADSRDRWQRPDELIGLLEISPGMVVADLGAGTGYFLPGLSAAVGPEGRVLALDVDRELVEHMVERSRDQGLANVEARVVPFDDPGLDPGSVDRVLIVNTWHHIDGRRAYAGKLAAALADGGRMYVVDFTEESPHGPPNNHRLSAAEVQAELEAGGLTAQVIDEDLPHQYVVVARRATP